MSNGGKHVRASHEERNVGSAAGRLPPKSGSSYKTSKPSMASADSRKQLGNNSDNGPGWPVGPKGLPSKISVGTTGNKSSAPGIKNSEWYAEITPFKESSIHSKTECRSKNFEAEC